MNKYKISASKWQKRYSLVLTAASEKEAKERVHSEWYSILTVTEIDDSELLWNKFIFEWKLDGKIKKWIIAWDDIFKIYKKLRNDLGYKIYFLYPESDKELDVESKKKILKDLEEWYNHGSNVKKISKKQTKKTSYTEKKSLEWFHMKKELDETYRLIEVVLEKLQNIIINPNIHVTDEKKEKITNIYNSIVKVKKSTNIEKLKQVWELALLKIWEIELASLEWEKTKKAQKLLKETNSLLKQVGSSEQFKEKNKNLTYIIETFKEDMKEKLFFFKNIKKSLKDWGKKKIIDKESYNFLKTLLLLDKYQERLKKNNKNIQKNIFKILIPSKSNQEIRENILIKRRVIKQNISLLKAKKSGKVTSYTGVMKWYKKIVEKIINTVRVFDNYIFYVVVSYSILFIVYINMTHLWYDFSTYSFNYTGIFYFIFILFLFILTSISRGVFALTLNFVFLFFILIFWVVNF